jgi:microcystin-dependent protein
MPEVIKTAVLAAGEGLPPGTVIAFAGHNTPLGWLPCDGAEVTRADHTALFEAIGETFGSGDGEFTFNLPDLNGRVPIGTSPPSPGSPTLALGESVGAAEHLLTEEELPAHQHRVGFQDDGQVVSGNFDFVLGAKTTWSLSGDNPVVGIQPPGDGLTAPTGEGQPFSIMQPGLGLHFLIKT